jgi:hypothetical protein
VESSETLPASTAGNFAGSSAKPSRVSPPGARHGKPWRCGALKYSQDGIVNYRFNHLKDIYIFIDIYIYISIYCE